MSNKECTDLRTMYLGLLKKSVLNTLYLEDELRIHYLKKCIENNDSYTYKALHDIKNFWPEEWEKLKESRNIGRFIDRDIKNSGFNHSMIGVKRMESLHNCLDYVNNNNIPGDLVECGVWRGGGTIFMAGYVKAHEDSSRDIYVVDSFEGLPKPSLPQDRSLDLSKEKFPQLAVDEEEVKNNFAKYDLLDDHIHFVKGWFKDSLPKCDMEQIALLRMDGDLYESTMDILDNLYDKVVESGVIIVDDYAIKPCRLAVEDFFKKRNLPFPNYQEIDWTGIWWTKK